MPESSKASLSHYLPSKEQLAAAYLADLRAQFEVALDLEGTHRGSDVAIRVHLLDKPSAKSEFFGCPFHNDWTETHSSTLVLNEVRARLVD
jgi:hypothetical protein